MKTEFIEVSRQLESPVESEAQLMLRKALASLGPHGENWVCGMSRSYDGKKSCAGWAVRKAIAGGTPKEWCGFDHHPALVAINAASKQLCGHPHAQGFNDLYAKSFTDIRKLFP